MEERTQKHLSTARANQDYSLTIFHDDDASATELNWAAVAAFYAAMHAVNAYLWELARLEPVNHRDRRDIIEQWPTLGPLRAAYAALFDQSVTARYKPDSKVTRSRLNTLVNRHLTRVLTTIERELPDLPDDE